jgi:hypothetical protein
VWTWACPFCSGPQINRIANLVVAPLYAVMVALSCIGEEWVNHLLGSTVEVVLRLAIVRTAWTWGRGVR